MGNSPRYKGESFIAGKHYTIPQKIYMIHTSREICDWILKFNFINDRKNIETLQALHIHPGRITTFSGFLYPGIFRDYFFGGLEYHWLKL